MTTENNVIEDELNSMFHQTAPPAPVIDMCEVTKNGLAELSEFVSKMKSTSKSTEKKLILADYAESDFVLTALEYVENPFKKYHVTSRNCIKNDHIVNHHHTNIWALLDDLTARTLSGHDAIAAVNFMVEMYGYEDLIHSIIDKNLKTRASASLINKVFPRHIPTFNIALAKPYEAKRCEWVTRWYGSRKLDGVRCISIFTPTDDGGKVMCYSRVGNEFTTLGVVKEAVLKLGLTQPTVFDGEICIMDENDKEDFQGIMKEIKKKDHTIEYPRYILFDCLTREEFDSEMSISDLTERLGRLDDIIPTNDPVLSVLPQTLITSDEHLSEMIDDADKNGFEGVMVRRDTTYEGKRTFNLMKVKKFHDAEYKVLDIGTAKHRILVPCEESNTMVETEINVMAQVFIEHKGEEVEVGSGWSQAQRIRYYENPEEIIGKTITVQYFEETVDQNGKISLRFPTVKHVWDEGRNV